jgi:hypothetical protein
VLESRLGVLAEIRRLYLQRVLQGVPGRPSSLVSVTRRAGMDGACELTFKRVRMYMMPAFVLWLQTWEVSKSRQREDGCSLQEVTLSPRLWLFELSPSRRQQCRWSVICTPLYYTYT